MACHLSLAGVPCLSASLRTPRTSNCSRSNVSRSQNVQNTRRTCRFVRQTVQASAHEASPQAAPEQSQISIELMKQMETSITEALRADKVTVQDVYGDGRHVSIEVISAEFEGQSSVKRQRLVYKVNDAHEKPA